jgi:hypothetical protein
MKPQPNSTDLMMPDKLKLPVIHEGKELTGRQIHFGALAHKAFKDGINPPSWVQDKETWDKAKTAANKTYSLDDDAYWPVTLHIYENMGGGIGGGSSTNAAQPSDRKLIRAIMTEPAFPKKLVPEWFTYMPGGVSEIIADYDSEPLQIAVLVNANTVAKINGYMAKIKARWPNLQFYGDDEKHSEDKATLREPMEFFWDDQPQPGRVRLKGRWTSLGRQEIEDEIYITHSPSFDTDADHDSLVRCADGVLRFPAGARGSRENPAEITRVGLSLLTLTNDPAFRHMPLIAAVNRGGEPQHKPGGQPAATQGATTTMKLYFIKAHGTYTKGQDVELPDADAAGLLALGVCIHASSKQSFLDLEKDKTEAGKREEAALALVKARNRATVQTAYDIGVQRGAFVPNATLKIDGKDVPEVDDLLVRGENDPDFICRYINAASPKPGRANLGSRLTAPEDSRVTVTIGQAGDLKDNVAALRAMREPIPKLIQACTPKGMRDAIDEARKAAVIFANGIEPHLRKGGVTRHDLLVRAVDTSTTDSEFGWLQGMLILQRDLGFLVNRIISMKAFSVDLIGEPILFMNWAASRYFTVPGVQTATYNNQNQTVTWAGATTPMVNNVQVLMDQLVRVPINIPMALLAQTTRNLQAEQKPVILYALAEAIDKFMFGIAFNGKANSTGVVIVATGQAQNIPMPNFNLNSLSDIGAAMDRAKMPRDPGSRFAVLYSDYEWQLTKDRDVLLIEAIRAAGREDEEDTFTSGELPVIKGIKPYGSQLAISGANYGFAGTRAGLVFCGRQPYNFKDVWTDVPIPGSVDLLVEPRTGFGVQYIRFFDLLNENADSKVLAMYGGAIGNPALIMPILNQPPLASGIKTQQPGN